MIKTAILASAICFAFVVPASAQQALSCDEASLTKMRADIDAMTDAGAKEKSLKSWEAANTAFKAKNLDECNARMGDNTPSEKVGGENTNNTTQQ